MVDGATNVVHVRDVARGHLQAAERGTPGERYLLGGHDVRWVDLLERVAELSGVRHPLLVLPPETAAWARELQAFDLPGIPSAEGIAHGPGLALLLAQGAARARLPQPVARPDAAGDDRLYRHLIDGGVLGGGLPSALSLGAAGLRLAGRTGLLGGLRAAQGRLGRRLVVGA